MTNEELATRIKAGEQEYIPELWQQCYKFICKQANRRFYATGGRGGVELDDLIQAGFLAMVEAIRYFNPISGYGFIAALDLRLKHHFDAAGGFRRYDPLDDCASLDRPAGDDGPTIGDLTPDPVDRIEAADLQIWREQLQFAVAAELSRLPVDQREIIQRRYWSGASRKEIAEEKGTTRETIRREEEKALAALRSGPLRSYREICVDELTPWFKQARLRGQWDGRTAEMIVSIRENIRKRIKDA